MQVFKQVTDLIAGIRKDIDAQTTRLKRQGEFDSPELEDLNEADAFLRKSLDQLRQAQQRIRV
jgi:hypothetical protein